MKISYEHHPQDARVKENTDGKNQTLGSNMSHDAINGGIVLSVENHPNDSRVRIDESGTVQTLTNRMGTGGGNVPMVMEHTYSIQGMSIGRETGPNGDGINEDVSFTLNTKDKHAVCEPDTYIVRRLTPTECARLQGFPDLWGHFDKKEDMTDEEYLFWKDVRTTYCNTYGKEVKDWTKPQIINWYNRLHTDAAEYKMWGNGLALPNALYVMEGIEDALKNEVKSGISRDSADKTGKISEG